MPERQSPEHEKPTAGPLARLPPAEHAVAARLGRLDAPGLLSLQRTIGNAAVGRVLARQSPPPMLDEWDQMMADQAKLGEKLRKRMIDTITGPDRILFLSRLRALDKTERLALREDAEFWKQLRRTCWRPGTGRCSCGSSTGTSGQPRSTS